MDSHVRKKVSRTNPLINKGDREGALKGLKRKLGGNEDALNGEGTKAGGNWHIEKCDLRDYLIVVTLI